ncbi:LysR family transcriptional regulator [Erwiniaceae bacterium BAC15a-03b]|uniref:LysR family transcriptional regulator n=1 Tax=Winslowiella arboricola TaxID=2978220 RepID=A0A9J6PLM1_9GAMM|nr:LysR family transcriptional regulator [Winslowiella arboricola]MCU5773331.1 LysR family transcriptional regulator [Winslowiella arboricola]MCU5779217.1 LysR family transcriptional regulator [Winslowiella arboricola]
MISDIRTLDLNLLKALDALLEERSVTRAAARLSLTQPAVSGMLVRLRESFDDALFVRSQRGVIPTARALELAAPVRAILSNIEGLLQPAAFIPAQASMTLTIASTDYALRAVIVPFLAILRQQAPGIRVAVRPVDHTKLQSQLERGDIDLALVTPESSHPDLHARRLFDERYICLLRTGHPAAAGEMTLARFCELEHALVSYEGEAFSGVTDHALAQIGQQRKVSVSVSSFLVLPELLRVSDLIAVVPQRLAVNTQGLVSMEPPVAIPGFTKLAVWHARNHSSPAQRWIREVLFNAAYPSV